VQIGRQEEAQGGTEVKAMGPSGACAVSQGGSAFGKGTELRGLYVPHQLEGIAAGVIAEDWPVWISVLPALGITDVAAWGPRPDYMTTFFTQECPGLHIVSTKQQLIAKKMDMVFVSGGPKFVKQICLDLGLSRGNLLEGVMKGDNFLSFVPLHLSALERSSDLEGWFKGMFRHN
jgi:hypothetical protein